jgi:hypothetical protein
MSAAKTAEASIDGKYRLIERLDGDDQIVRYLAEHTSIHRSVEVLVLAPGAVPDGDAAAELLRGARVLGGATHRNLQSVVDSGRDAEGRPFVVLEALRGKTLAQIVSEHPNGLERQRAARIVMQILEALRTLHDAGVVLRCLSPEHIVVEYLNAGEELAKLRSVRGAALLIEGGAAPVAPRRSYAPQLAPELRRGEAGLDPRVDFFSVGTILRLLLTGDARASEERLPDAVRRALARACAEDPDDRFANADGFLQAVALLLPTSERPPREQMPTPVDSLHADLQYLRLRRATRHSTRSSVSEGAGRLWLLPVLLTIEAIYRRFGPGVWGEISGRVADAETLLPGAGHTPMHMERGVSAALFSEILATVDEVAGGGDLALVAEIGEAVAKRGLRRLFPDLPEPLTVDALVAAFPYVWSRIARDGKARVQRISERSARASVERQLSPSLELSGLLGGLLRQALREAGANDPEIVLISSEALGDTKDLYGLEWR